MAPRIVQAQSRDNVRERRVDQIVITFARVQPLDSAGGVFRLVDRKVEDFVRRSNASGSDESEGDGEESSQPDLATRSVRQLFS